MTLTQLATYQSCVYSFAEEQWPRGNILLRRPSIFLDICTDFCLLQLVCCSVLTVTYCGFPFVFITTTLQSHCPISPRTMKDGCDCWRPHVCLPAQMMCYIPGRPLMFLMSTNQNVSPHLTVYCYD